MRVKIPMTGTVSKYNPKLAKYGGSSGIEGAPNDPVRPVPVNLGNVSWDLVSVDLKKDLMEIEVSPAEVISVLKEQGDPNRPEDWLTRRATPKEKQDALDCVRALVEGHTVSELYQMSHCPRLKKPKEGSEIEARR